MLVIIITLVLSVLFTIFGIMFNGEYDFRKYFVPICMVVAIIGYIIFGIMVIFAIVVNTGIKGDIAANQQLYDSLVYQLEKDMYDNDNDIGKLEFYEKVTDWNSDLARGKALQYDPWVGVFYPNIYDNFDFIELPNNRKGDS